MPNNSTLILKRKLKIDLSGNNAFFLWGARKTGKTTFLKAEFPSAKFYDLLLTDLQTKLSLHPNRLREEVLAQKPAIVILDEIQKCPELMPEIHWCLENTPTKFILCGSSARKLKRKAADLLGGRAWRYEMHPLSISEIQNFDLLRALNHGLIPQHYVSNQPEKFLESYVLDYLHQEIQNEALVRNISAFSRFLDTVSATHGQMINYSNIATQTGVSAKTVREYFQILEDTLLGYRLNAWANGKRRMIETGRFYLFDIGLVRALNKTKTIEAGTEPFGRAFEHWVLHEIKCYLTYTGKRKELHYWRTITGLEVDLIVGEMEIAIEIKAKENIGLRDLKGLCALLSEEKPKQSLVISLDESKRQLENGILIWPYHDFFTALWGGEIMKS